ncbi:hypothetical protein GCM10023340_11880 [Nocardioides marinquilinus]|uniref:DUF1707 domain-containing protein n=1 Tax=Nocardioides marinquilinus TaxID=1210400 RepID=A0ABP9PH90_9ACTN
MSPDPAREHLRVSDAERHEVAEVLRRAAGEGRLDLDELDERLEATYAARTYADLVPLTLDLPDDGSSPLPARPATGPAPAVRLEKTPEPPAPDGVRARQRHLAVMGGVDRKGAWTVPADLTIVAVMGGADLDMRQARYAARECVVTVHALMGGATIVVGPDVDVVMEGIGIMGGFAGPSDRDTPPPQVGAQVLRVRGVAIMGGVTVKRRPLPGVDDGRRRHRLH